MRSLNIDLHCILAAFALRLLINKSLISGMLLVLLLFRSPLHTARNGMRSERIEHGMNTALKVRCHKFCYLHYFILKKTNNPETTIGNAGHG